ncbi:hypothetical protein C1646_758978 [Rhizophagus diaphanus]|nr:hypothetical protein C1646_758978 [Rhizophagus diaphanus] [Rhizophagus sp. MUCL 43196]
MICSNKSNIVKRIFLQEVNNIKRYYASTIQLPFHPHYVPPGQPTTITTTSDIWKQNKTSKTSRFVPTINRLQETSFSKREDIFMSMNFFGDTYNETSKRKIPFIFRISTICFVAASLIRFYHRGSKGSKGNKDSNNNIKLNQKSIYDNNDVHLDQNTG